MNASTRDCPVLLTKNEVGWIEFIRLLSDDRDPVPTLAAVQALRAVISGNQS